MKTPNTMNQMNEIGRRCRLTALLLFSFISLPAGANPRTQGLYEEVPVQKVFIPGHGYDDNDPIEAMVVGELPNPCYTLGGVWSQKSTDGTSFYVHQLAWRETSGNCASSDTLLEPVPFTSRLTLGELAAGDYQLTYDTRWKRGVIRPFSVSKADSMNTDNFDYAVVQGVEMDPNQPAGQPLQAVITGVLTNTCSDFVRPIRVERVDDITVVYPILKHTGSECHGATRPFRETVELGAYAPNWYMLTARSRNGAAVSQVFNVGHY